MFLKLESLYQNLKPQVQLAEDTIPLAGIDSTARIKCNLLLLKKQLLEFFFDDFNYYFQKEFHVTFSTNSATNAFNKPAIAFGLGSFDQLLIDSANRKRKDI